MTLRELKAKIKSTAGIELPTAKALLLSGDRPIFESRVEDSILKVFENGFAVYISGNRSTVLRADQPVSYTYLFCTRETNTLPESDFLDEDCTIYLLMIGEDRIQHNQSTNGGKASIFLGNEEFDNIEDPSPSPEDVCMNDDLICRICTLLTPFQQEILKLTCGQGYTVREAAKELGVSYSYVAQVLRSIKKMVKENFENE